MIHAAILCRVSSGGQADNTSIPEQRRLLTAMCDERGWTHQVFEEVHSGGDKLEDRPIFGDILARIKAGEFSRLVVLVVDRGTRAGAGEMERVGKLLADAGAKLVTRRTEYDPREAEDQIDLEQQALDARKDNLRRKDRTTRGREAVVREGGFGGHPIPYGWRRVWDPDGSTRFEINEVEADAVRSLFALYVTGTVGAYQLAEMTSLDVGTVKRILRNPRYAGIEHWRRHKTDTSHLLPSLTVASKVWPAIISVDLFEQAQDVRERRGTGSNRGKVRWPLTGILRCATCGKGMQGSAQLGGRYVYYKCPARCPSPQRWHALDAHRAVLASLGDIYGHWHGRGWSLMATAGDEVAALQARLVILDRSEAELWAAKVAGMADDQYARLNAAHQDQRRAVDDELKALKRRARPMAAAGDLGADLAMIAADPEAVTDIERLRLLFASLLVSVTLAATDVTTRRSTMTVPVLRVERATGTHGRDWVAPVSAL